MCKPIAPSPMTGLPRANLVSFCFLLFLACGTRDREVEPEVAAPRDAVALVGKWKRLAPLRIAGDTLMLDAAGTASGIVPWGESRDLLARHWSIRFGSRSPVEERADWRHGYSNGGDPECFLKDDRACVSMPMLCVGSGKLESCHPFILVARS